MPKRSRGDARFPLPVLIILAIVLGIATAIGARVYERGWSATAGSVRDAASRLRESSEEAATSARVKGALALSERVSAFDIDVDSEAGVVTLTGEVSSDSERRLAGMIANNAVGSSEIRNLLVVNPAAEPDAERQRLIGRIRDLDAETTLRERLNRRYVLKDDDIDVSVNDGVATLSGRVDSPSDAALAADLAGRADGVQRVRNRLVVVRASEPDASDDDDLGARVEREISGLGRIVDADRIVIETAGGVVRLEGIVGSEAEKMLVEVKVSGVPGVQKVVNELRVGVR